MASRYYRRQAGWRVLRRGPGAAHLPAPSTDIAPDLAKRHRRDSRILVWDHCAGEIMKAAITGKRAYMAEAARCLIVALEQENWLKR
jgi:hypothetical protein